MQHFVDLILARNDLTRQRLRALGVSTPTIVCPDTAFLLPAHESPFSEAISRHKANYPIVGFSMSHQAVWQSHGSEIYLNTMASLADYIVDKINAKILLIPNELSDRSTYDDVFVANEIRQRMSNPGKTIIFSEENNAWEIKGIIGQCDVLVASRYHSVISGLSQGIPVLAVGWHDKYPEVLRLVGQDRHLCSIKSLNFNDLRDNFDFLWQKRHQINSEINAALPLIRENIFNGGKAVSRLLKEIGS
jgi:polysaccharide pyruvyl transferase WcaK-like protein